MASRAVALGKLATIRLVEDNPGDVWLPRRRSLHRRGKHAGAPRPSLIIPRGFRRWRQSLETVKTIGDFWLSVVELPPF